ncbi:MAG TPA: alpha/beta hydrolase [Hyphomicrobiaceae bacterium]|jgi:pimeloyl-ACP methyl ester carboxylesterase|nr:alpha/beta hydrolase [Hyphomicrobiaceae bacterium]
MLKYEFADVNGVRLHYARAGQGKLILFVHGFPEFWYAWKDLLPEFGRDHLAVAPDMRGYNLSSKPTDVTDYAVPHLVDDLRALARSLGHEKFILVAHDWGGGVAWSLGIHHPECLEKLVIINAPHPALFERELNRNPAQQAASQYMLLFRSPKAEATLSANNYAFLVDAVLTRGLKKGHFTEDDRQTYLTAWSQPGALTGSLNWYRAAGIGPPTSSDKAHSFEPSAGPSKVSVPTLVIWGEKDQALVKENLDGLDQHVPDLTVRRIADGTHWVIHEQPALVAAHIREFIARP